MKQLKYIAISVLSLGLFSCDDDIVDELRGPEEATVIVPELTQGSADFSNFVAVGASFTAGFTDNALFIASQGHSFPKTMADKFALVGGGNFTQPLMNDNFGGLAAGGNRILQPRLVFGGAGPVPLESVIGEVTVTTDIVLNNPTGPFNNLGVPGAKSFHMVANGYGNIANLPNANPYAVRITGDSPNASMLELAVAQNPTFFTLSEVGGNDVLGFATSGGTGQDQTGNTNPLTYGSNDITDPNVFAASLNAMVTALTANGAKGVVGNVPNITSLSFFTTVPHNPIPLDAATANAVNQAYAAYNGGLQQAFQALNGTGLFTEEELNRRLISFEASENNAVVIIDEDLTDLGSINPAFAGLPQLRQATAADLLVLPASSFIGTLADPSNPLSVNGVAVPLSDQWVLTPEEQLSVENATNAYNSTISAIVSSNPNVALVDLNSILNQAATSGIEFDDYNLNTDLVFGGLVSLDGVHLSARGYALMANSFLKAIDAEFGSNFEASGNLAKAADFPTLYSATLQ